MPHCGCAAKVLCAVSGVSILYGLYVAFQVYSADYAEDNPAFEEAKTSINISNAIFDNYLMAPTDKDCSTVSAGITVRWECAGDTTCTDGEFAEDVEVIDKCEILTGFPNHNVVAQFDGYQKTCEGFDEDSTVPCWPGKYTVTSTEPIYYLNEAMHLLISAALLLTAVLGAFVQFCCAGCCGVGALVAFCAASPPPQSPNAGQVEMGQPMQQQMA